MGGGSQGENISKGDTTQNYLNWPRNRYMEKFSAKKTKSILWEKNQNKTKKQTNHKIISEWNFGLLIIIENLRIVAFYKDFEQLHRIAIYISDKVSTTTT